MNETAGAAPDAASGDREAITPPLMAFARRYLRALESRDYMPMGLNGWRSHPQATEMFVPVRTRLPPSGFEEWEEYTAIETLVNERPRLRRLITEPMNAPTDQLPDFRGLLSGVVALPLERYEAINGPDRERLADLVEEFADWFCRDADPIFLAKPVVGFSAPDTLTLAPGVKVRRATDDEVSAMLHMGALNEGSRPNLTEVSGIQVFEAARWVVTLDYSRPRFCGASGPNPVNEPVKELEMVANDWLAVLRILTPANVLLGPTFTTQLSGGIASGGWTMGYGPPTRFAWHNPATITPDTRDTFMMLAKRIRNGLAQRLKIAHGLHRFSEAAARGTPADRLVDLVIVLEAMLAKSPGAASYQVSRRASAMVTHLGLSAARVYEFVSAAYGARSKIVHGGTPDHKNLAGEACTIEEQVLELDRLVAAMLRQVLSSSTEEKPADTADRLISSALDSRQVPPATGDPTSYEVAVTYESGRFSAVPPADNAARVYGTTLDQLGTRLAQAIALWTQVPCAPDSIRVQLDDDAQAAIS